MREILVLLAKKHKQWCAIVRNFGATEAIVEDIVQEMYLRIGQMENPSKISYGEADINDFYVFLTLRSVFVDYTRVKRPQVRGEFPNFEEDELDSDREEAWERLYEKVIAECNSFGRYGLILSQMYFKTKMSLRDIADRSGIGMYSIYNSIKHYRSHLQDTLGEDYEDYINKDYDKI